MKIIKVESCEKCLHHGMAQDNTLAGLYFCHKKKKFIGSQLNYLPDWCPLEDANNQINMDKLKPVLFELAHSHSLLAQAEYNRDPGYNDAHFSHKAENRLIEFMQEYKIFEEFLEWENETVRTVKASAIMTP